MSEPIRDREEAFINNNTELASVLFRDKMAGYPDLYSTYLEYCTRTNEAYQSYVVDKGGMPSASIVLTYGRMEKAIRKAKEQTALGDYLPTDHTLVATATNKQLKSMEVGWGMTSVQIQLT